MKTPSDMWHKAWPDDGAFVRASAQDLERLIEAARADECEACAQLVDAIEARCVAKDVDDPPLAHVAAAIRARTTP